MTTWIHKADERASRELMIESGAGAMHFSKIDMGDRLRGWFVCVSVCVRMGK